MMFCLPSMVLIVLDVIFKDHKDEVGYLFVVLDIIDSENELLLCQICREVIWQRQSSFLNLASCLDTWTGRILSYFPYEYNCRNNITLNFSSVNYDKLIEISINHLMI